MGAHREFDVRIRFFRNVEGGSADLELFCHCGCDGKITSFNPVSGAAAPGVTHLQIKEEAIRTNFPASSNWLPGFSLALVFIKLSN